MRWEPEAEALLKKVPFLVRKKVKRKIEELVRQQGRNHVTKEAVLEAKERFKARAGEVEEGFVVEGCFGISACPNAVTHSQALLSRLEEILKDREITRFLRQRVGGPLKHHHQFRVALAECPNACSQVQIRDFALIGHAEIEILAENCQFCGECESSCEDQALELSSQGPEIDKKQCLGCGVCVRVCRFGALGLVRTGYRVLIGGKLGRRPRLATEIASLATEEQVVELFERVLSFYLRHNKSGERLGAILSRLGWERSLKEILS
jgi:dissimilatory sulfite reductase (desulfoviridin) alpha/beta subunit